MLINKTTIILIQPWVEDFYNTDCRTQPIGLAYLAGSLMKRFPAMEIIIYDALTGGEKKSIPWPEEFQYLKPYYGFPDRSPDSLFHQFYRFGKSEDTIARELSEKKKPLLIGISSLFTPYYRQSLDMARICKKIFPDVPVVMGGSHATMHPDMLLNARSNGMYVCDYVLRGEGEAGICELTEALLGLRSFDSVKNLTVRKSINHKIAHDGENAGLPEAPDMHSLAIPLFPGLSPENYTYGKKPMSFLITGRSCPHRCTFCSIHSVFGYRFRVRNPQDVIDEIKIRFHEGIRHFDIEDDNFTANKKNAEVLLSAAANLKLPVTFSAMNGLSYHSLDENLLSLMKKAGFASLNLSLVSSDRDILELSQRPHTVEKFKKIVRFAAELNLAVTAYYILGMPGQTLPEMTDTLLMLAREQCLIGASPFYFTPGSPIHLAMKKSGSVSLASEGKDPFFSARLTAMDVETENFSREDIYTLFRLTRLINYMKSGIDRGLKIQDSYFDRAKETLTGGRWYFENRGTAVEAPFSKKVFNCIAGRDIEIRGHKASAKIKINP